ncbi:MAG: orotidine-5'-phosphate decarboxylase [Promethearchaeota archaeon]|nr:MAG: orotidine-5'-phosphate decarboxylase [Candidatus Lokiarchaeota archaeon]
MMSFIEKLINSILDKKSVVCMGLDPRLEKEGEIPQYLIKNLEEPNKIILEFNKSLIDEACDLIPVIKPQIAFYEKYDVLNSLKETIQYAHKKDLLVILDSKRNDIGTTSKAYADSTFNIYQPDACTLNGYLGIDSIKPYLDYYSNKGIFVLVKTSNPSSSEFQDLFSIKLGEVDEKITEVQRENVKLERNYIQMAKLINSWNENLQLFSNYSNLGAVVGATFPNQLKKIRKIIPHSFILIPGYGAQGATSKDIVNGFDSEGLGAIVNSSRGIIFAYNKDKKYSPSQFDKAARAEIEQMNESINKMIF